MGTTGWALLALVGPVLIMIAVRNMSEILDRLEALLRRLRPGPPRPEGLPVERLAADLHRLSVDLAAAEWSDAPAKAARLRAAAMAYDDALREACRTFGVPFPGPSPLPAIERLQTEAALAQKGLTW
jgi:hypothetical protein